MTIKGVLVEDINKLRNGVAELDHRLELFQEGVNYFGEERNDVSKLEKEVKVIFQE